MPTYVPKPRQRCKVCDTPERRRLVDASFAEGMSAEAIGRRESATGWKVSTATLMRHRALHYVPPPPPDVAKTKKDLAALLMDRIYDHAAGDGVDLMDPAIQPALKTGLAAQKLLETRESKTSDRKTGVAIALILSGATGGGPPAHLLLEDGQIIDSTATEVEDDGDE